MLDPRLFRYRGFSAGSLTVMVQFFATFGLFFVVIQYLQFVVGRSPLGAAVALLPLPLVMIPLARNAPRIARKVGFKRLAPLGLAADGGRSGRDLAGRRRPHVLARSPSAWCCSRPAWRLAGTPSTTAITESLPESKQGVASAVNDTARELGSALGIAILGSVLNQQYRDGMTEAVHGLPPARRRRCAELDRLHPVAARAVELGSARRQQLVAAAQRRSSTASAAHC